MYFKQSNTLIYYLLPNSMEIMENEGNVTFASSTEHPILKTVFVYWFTYDMLMVRKKAEDAISLI